MASDLGLNGLCTVPLACPSAPTPQYPTMLLRVLLSCDACVFVLIVSLFKTIEKQPDSFQGHSVREVDVPDGGSTDT